MNQTWQRLLTQQRDRPIVELIWRPINCDSCGAQSWKAWHAPEGGIMVQCDCCHTTRLVDTMPADAEV